MDIMIRCKGLFIFTIETEYTTNAIVEIIKWHNMRDEAYSLLCLGISKDLIFHTDGLKSPNEVWEKLQTLFGKKYEMRAHSLENELVFLSSSVFESLQVYLSKFKALVL